MKISVAVTSYNYGPFLANAIDSVMAQTRRVDEVFVVDDASADQDYAKRMAEIYDIDCYSRNLNHGLEKNFDDILRNIFTGDACMFLGADNYLAPRYIEECEKLLEQKYNIATTDSFIVGEFAKDIAPKRHKWYQDTQPHPVWHYTDEDITVNNWIHGSALFNREKALESGGFNKLDGSIGTDWDMWKNMIKKGYIVGKINKPLLYYRQHRLNYNKQNYL